MEFEGLHKLESMAHEIDMIFEIESTDYPYFYKKTDYGFIYIPCCDKWQNNLRNLSCCISFTQIESIIHPPKSFTTPSQPYTTRMIDIENNFQHKVGADIKSSFPLDLKDPEQTLLAIDLIKKYYVECAIPFFDYWSDIRVFLPFIETDFLDFMSLNSVFSDPPVLAKMVVWYLCGHPQYEEYAQFHIKRQDEMLLKRPDDRMTKIAAKQIRQVYKKLKTTKPLYDWDDSYLIQKEYPWPMNYRYEHLRNKTS